MPADSDLGPIMNLDEINSAIQGLVNEYGIPTFDVPNATSEGSGGKGGMTGPSTATSITSISPPACTPANAAVRTT